MKVISKKELSAHLASKFKDLTQQQAKSYVDEALDFIIDKLIEGNNIEFRNFGVLRQQTAKPRVGRNPQKPKVSVSIPERKVIKFKQGKRLKAGLSK